MSVLPPNLTRSSRMRNFVIVVSAFVLGGLVLPNIHVTWREPDSEAEVAGLNVKPAPPPQALSPEEAYARAAQAAYKSVVNIDTTQQYRVAPDFFGSWMLDEPRIGKAMTEGSGVIITRSGYILTNEHVVDVIGGPNATGRTIVVTLTDGRKLKGRIVGADYTTDVALVKVDANDLPAAQVGTSKGLIPGQMCVAIGNPYQLHFTVTHGVISALDRPVALPGGKIYPDLIQHDAGINPGNSGGPLVNLQGQVIGINTLVNEGAEGIGFAIPIDTALRVADELKRYGHVKRPWLGLLARTNTQQIAEAYNLPDVSGVIVAPYPGSQAEMAKLQAGDIITHINGQRVRTEDDFKAIQDKLHIGDQANLEVHRGNQFAQFKVTVGERP